MRVEQEEGRARAGPGGQREGESRRRTAGGGSSVGSSDGSRDSASLEAPADKSGS